MDAPWCRLCSSSETERLILEQLERSGLSARMRVHVHAQKALEGAPVEMANAKETAFESIAAAGLDVALKNKVYLELSRLHHTRGLPSSLPPPLPQSKEPVDFILEAQREWEEKLRRGVNALCTELGVPLARERSKQERDLIRKKWHSMGSGCSATELDRVHPVFSPRDFIEVLVRIQNPNFDPGERGSCGLLRVLINSKSVFELRRQFSALHPSVMQVEKVQPCAEYNRKATEVLRRGLSALARQLCKSGCPVADRRDLWSLALGVDCQHTEHVLHFDGLKSSVMRNSLLLEKIAIRDVKKAAANDDNYFVFEDIIHQVLLCFLHDSSLLPHYNHLSITPLKAYIKGNVSVSECETIYPPNGILPFHGFSMYVAPLCFLFDRSDHLYALFKHMYFRYFVHLHSISSRPQGILGLCSLFECLLQCKQPELFHYLTDIAAHPLQLVFGWLMTAFAGHLDSREVLLLWDRVIGFDSLEIVAVLAVALFEFRATNLFKATSQSEAEAVLSDLHCIKILPLLQHTLFV